MPPCASGGLGHEAYGTLSLLGGHAPLAVRISFIFPRDSCPVAPFSHFCSTTRCQFLRQQAARPYISSTTALWLPVPCLQIGMPAREGADAHMHIPGHWPTAPWLMPRTALGWAPCRGGGRA